MNSKSVLILCGVCFIASVWSTGLNVYQLNSFIELYKRRENADYIERVVGYLINVFEYENLENVFGFDLGQLDYLLFHKILLKCAYTSRVIRFEKQMLTSFEVDFYLKMFTRHYERHGQGGYLYYEQLSVVFDDLNIKEGEKQKALMLTAESIKTHGGLVVYAAEYLLIMLKMLPEVYIGYGLSTAQIEEFVGLYTLGKTESGSIDPVKIQNIFKRFQMATAEHEDLMLFESNRPAGKELMELMMFAAERSTGVNDNDDTALSTREVKKLIIKFGKLVYGKYGTVSKKKTNIFLQKFNAKYPNVNTNDFIDKEINVAEFMMFEIHAKLSAKHPKNDFCIKKFESIKYDDDVVMIEQ